MKILYFDCADRISGDTAPKALMELGEWEVQIRETMEAEPVRQPAEKQDVRRAL